MALEIERKYLVNLQEWQALSKPEVHHYRQGYILADPKKTIRIRLTDTKCFITIKGESIGATRSEYEYEIPREDAEELLNNFCVAEIEKSRYKIMYKNKLWEVDEFLGENEGLIVAEIELKKEDDIFEIPDWVANEVTGVERYYNANLAQNPYRDWKAELTQHYSSKVPRQILNNIADSMEAGLKCFINKTTFEVVSVPDDDRFPEMDWEDEVGPWKEDIDKVFENPDYIEIEKLDSSDSFKIMEYFALSLPESTTKTRLVTALEGHKPFSNFNHQIHNAGKEKEQWFQFRREREIVWVNDQLKGRV
jgi:CYTH domain-containing protein